MEEKIYRRSDSYVTYWPDRRHCLRQKHCRHHVARIGAGIVDCDVIAHDVVEPGSEGLKAVAAAFGPKTLLADGSMDRAYIGSVVFGDKAKKAQLEAILFPSSMPASTGKSKIEENKKSCHFP